MDTSQPSSSGGNRVYYSGVPGWRPENDASATVIYVNEGQQTGTSVGAGQPIATTVPLKDKDGNVIGSQTVSASGKIQERNLNGELTRSGQVKPEEVAAYLKQTSQALSHNQVMEDRAAKAKETQNTPTVKNPTPVPRSSPQPGYNPMTEEEYLAKQKAIEDKYFNNRTVFNNPQPGISQVPQTEKVPKSLFFDVPLVGQNVKYKKEMAALNSEFVKQYSEPDINNIALTPPAENPILADVAAGNVGVTSENIASLETAQAANLWKNPRGISQVPAYASDTTLGENLINQAASDAIAIYGTKEAIDLGVTFGTSAAISGGITYLAPKLLVSTADLLTKVLKYSYYASVTEQAAVASYDVITGKPGEAVRMTLQVGAQIAGYNFGQKVAIGIMNYQANTKAANFIKENFKEGEIIVYDEQTALIIQGTTPSLKFRVRPVVAYTTVVEAATSEAGGVKSGILTILKGKPQFITLSELPSYNYVVFEGRTASLAEFTTGRTPGAGNKLPVNYGQTTGKISIGEINPSGGRFTTSGFNNQLRGNTFQASITENGVMTSSLVLGKDTIKYSINELTFQNYPAKGQIVEVGAGFIYGQGGEPVQPTTALRRTAAPKGKPSDTIIIPPAADFFPQQTGRVMFYEQRSYPMKGAVGGRVYLYDGGVESPRVVEEIFIAMKQPTRSFFVPPQRVKTFQDIVKPQPETNQPTNTNKAGVSTILIPPIQETKKEQQPAAQQQRTEQPKQETFQETLKADTKKRWKVFIEPGKTETATQTASVSAADFGAGFKWDTATKQDSKARSATSTAADSMSKSKLDIGQDTKPATDFTPDTTSQMDFQPIQNTGSKSMTDSMTTGGMDFGSRNPPPPEPPRKNPFITSPTFEKKRSSTFQIFVRRKGAFKPVGSRQTAGLAINYGKEIVQNTAAASFKVKGNKADIMKAAKTLGRKFYQSRKEPGVYIQKNPFRISTGGEKREIPYAAKIRRKIKVY